VIFVSQLDQIQRLVDEMKLAEDVYSVRTGVENVDLNALGGPIMLTRKCYSQLNKNFLTCSAIRRTFLTFPSSSFRELRGA
jgi:hypothetical protein